MRHFLFPSLAVLALTTACKKNESMPTQQLSGTLSAAAQVPAVAAPSSGTGTVTGTFDPNTRLLTYTVNYSGLTGPPTMGHFHFGDARRAGPVFIPYPSVPTTTSGTITGTATLTPAQVDSFKNNRVYANIHTARNPPGELRANVVLQ